MERLDVDIGEDHGAGALVAHDQIMVLRLSTFRLLGKRMQQARPWIVSVIFETACGAGHTMERSILPMAGAQLARTLFFCPASRWPRGGSTCRPHA